LSTRVNTGITQTERETANGKRARSFERSCQSLEGESSEGKSQERYGVKQTRKATGGGNRWRGEEPQERNVLGLEGPGGAYSRYRKRWREENLKRGAWWAQATLGYVAKDSEGEGNRKRGSRTSLEECAGSYQEDLKRQQKC
jgi:hypothetical protein